MQMIYWEEKIYLNKSKLIPSIRESENRKNCYVGGHEAII